MARLDEIAEGIAMVLVTTPLPEPLRISLRGQGSADTTFLARAVVDSCERQGSPIKSIRVCVHVGSSLLKMYGNSNAGYEGVSIEASEALNSEIEFYRFSPKA